MPICTWGIEKAKNLRAKRRCVSCIKIPKEWIFSTLNRLNRLNRQKTKKKTPMLKM
jgi:hypothetical protein